MHTVYILDMRELGNVVSLKDFRLVTKVKSSTFQKVYYRVVVLFHIRENETFTGCFVNDRILVKFLRRRTGIAGGWNMFDIHLPFNTELRGSVIRFGVTFVLEKEQNWNNQVSINVVQEIRGAGHTLLRCGVCHTIHRPIW